MCAHKKGFAIVLPPVTTDIIKISLLNLQLPIDSFELKILHHCEKSLVLQRSLKKMSNFHKTVDIYYYQKENFHIILCAM